MNNNMNVCMCINIHTLKINYLYRLQLIVKCRENYKMLILRTHTITYKFGCKWRYFCKTVNRTIYPMKINHRKLSKETWRSKRITNIKKLDFATFRCRYFINIAVIRGRALPMWEKYEHIIHDMCTFRVKFLWTFSRKCMLRKLKIWHQIYNQRSKKSL